MKWTLAFQNVWGLFQIYKLLQQFVDNLFVFYSQAWINDLNIFWSNFIK